MPVPEVDPVEEHPTLVAVSPSFADFVMGPSQYVAFPDESLYIKWQPVPRSAVSAEEQEDEPDVPVPVVAPPEHVPEQSGIPKLFQSDWFPAPGSQQKFSLVTVLHCASIFLI